MKIMKMPENIWDRYGPYPKKKEKKRFKEGGFLKRSYEWLKWKIADNGSFSFDLPSIEH